MHANIMAYRTPLVDMGEHPGHGLLVLLSLFLGGDCIGIDSAGELHGFFRAAVLTPSFVLFFPFLDLRLDLEPQCALQRTECALRCSAWDSPQTAMCLLICSAVAAAKTRHFPQEKLPQ